MSRVRGFEKISFSQFSKDVNIENDNLEEIYDCLCLPSRSTPSSAGYDFYAIQDITLNPGEQKVIPTGFKSYMQCNEFLAILVRSSHGFKFNLRLMNQMGVIDADYYNNPKNEGHIFIALKNEGEKVWSVKSNEAFAQAIFMNYLCIDKDQPKSSKRVGGIGSTDRR